MPHLRFVAVISYGLWQARFDGSPGALGRPLRVNGRDLTVVGVTPQAFQGTVMGLNVDVWVPATLAPVVASGSRELETRSARLLADGKETRDTDPGFRCEGILLAAYDLAGRSSDPAFTRTLAARLLERARALPGVESAAIASSVPLDIHGLPSRMFTIGGRARSDGRFDAALAAIGIYAVVAYTVSLRTTEIGVRLAIGATGGRVVAGFVGQSLAVVSVGAIAGWAVAFAAASAFAPGGRIEPSVFIGVPAVLLGVAALACWLPARRATRVDPVVALRAE